MNIVVLLLAVYGVIAILLARELLGFTRDSNRRDTMLASQSIISFIWYLEYKMEAKNSIRILRHYRLHGERDTHPGCKSHFHLIEDQNRIVTAAIIDGQQYFVLNPQHVFSY